jgi:hippurate hydrolase
MRLGAAKHLAETRRYSGGRQCHPSAGGGSGIDCGAKRILDDGLFERFRATRSSRGTNHPGSPARVFRYHRGAFMSASDHAWITVTGAGGHARPHRSLLRAARYDFNDENLTGAAAFWARLVERIL